MMKDSKYREYIYWGITAVIVISCGICVTAIFIRWDSVRNAISTINGILAPVVYGFILAYLLNPVYNWITKTLYKLIGSRFKNRKHGRRLSKIIATLSSLILLLLFMIGLIMLVIPQVWDTIKGIINSLPSYALTISHWIEDLFAANPDLESTIMSYYTQIMNRLISWTQSAGTIQNIERLVTGVYTGLMNVLVFFKNFFLGIVVMVYLLNMKEKLRPQLKKIVYGIFPVGIANNIIDKFRFIHSMFGGFISGKILDSIIIGLITFIWLNIIKMPFALLVSVIIGVTNVIPYFGPFIGAVPSALLILLVSPRQCLFFLISILVIQQFDGNILGPRILGNTTGLSSFWVLFAILFFGGLMGPVGMIIGVPTFAVIYKLISEFIDSRLRAKELSTDTKDYRDLDHIDRGTGSYIDKHS